jgi:hypothetical protein
MSFQITILKVLAGHPEGRASLPDLKRAMAILITSGSDWTDRTKRLAARAPDLDIFSQSFVLRDNAGWQITGAGRAFLDFLQTPIQPTSDGHVTTMVPRQSPRINQKNAYPKNQTDTGMPVKNPDWNSVVITRKSASDGSLVHRNAVEVAHSSKLSRRPPPAGCS